jgi:hypothetical protein
MVDSFKSPNVGRLWNQSSEFLMINRPRKSNSCYEILIASGLYTKKQEDPPYKVDTML